MKKHLNIILFLLVTGAALSGCGDFLEPQSQQYFIPKTAQQINDMLLGEAYARNQIGLGYEVTAMIQLLDDDVEPTTEVAGYLSYSSGQSYRGLFYLCTWQPDMDVQMPLAASGSSLYSNLWITNYNLILGTNAALDYADLVEGTRQEINLIKAQAYALRGFYYFLLVNIYGKPYNEAPDSPGVPINLSSNVETRELPRASVRAVYEQILADLDRAESCYGELPEAWQYRPDFRTSLPMVQLLKSRVYLYMENWSEASRYAGKVIDNWNFELIDLNTLSLGTHERYFPFISPESPETIWLYGCLNDVNPYVYSPTYQDSFLAPSKRTFRASEGLMAGYSGGDLRPDWYIFQETAGAETIHLALGKHRIDPGYGTLPSYQGFSRAFRLSEAYLNLAEAAALNSDEETARQTINTLRQHRMTPDQYQPITLSGEALVEFIRHERRLELCFENHRWFDLRRYGMPSISRKWRSQLDNAQSPLLTYVLQEKDPAYTLPIPEDVLEKNRALKQNELAPVRQGE